MNQIWEDRYNSNVKILDSSIDKANFNDIFSNLVFFIMKKVQFLNNSIDFFQFGKIDLANCQIICLRYYKICQLIEKARKFVVKLKEKELDFWINLITEKYPYYSM